MSGSEREEASRDAAVTRRRLPFDPDATRFILVPLVLGAIVLAGALLAGGLWPALSLPFFTAALFCAWFFRDPRREVPSAANVAVAPADGRVTLVEERPAGLRISIFLNVFDVHVNRAPVAGQVNEITYHEGRFLAAYKPDVHLKNERNHVTLATEHGPVEVVQIAGLVARRIVCRVGVGSSLRRGERFGLIRFGSCTELKLPPGWAPCVKPGQRVRGGTTVVATRGGQGVTA
jgi:phosphatidylserine decarboxylase